MKKTRTHKGSIFGKLIGSYVIFSLAAVALILGGLFMFITFSPKSPALSNFPGVSVNEDGTADDLEIIYHFGGWVEELDSNYQVVEVHGKKLTSEQSYTPEQLIDMTVFPDDAQTDFFDADSAVSGNETTETGKGSDYHIFWQKRGEGYYLIFYPLDAFNIVFNMDVDKAVITNISGGELLVVLLLLLADVFAVSFYILRKIKRPLDNLISGMERVEQGEEQVELSMQTEREFMEIGQAFNRMTEQLHMQKAENEKMAKSRQRMLLELSHDIKTPVATIKSCACALQEGMVPDGELGRYYETIVLKAERVNTMSEDLFTMLKMESEDYQLELKQVNLAELARRICAEYYAEITEAGFDFVISIPEEPFLVQGDEKLLTRVISNLLTNAKKYNRNGKEIRIILDRQKDVRLEIEDDGDEIAPEVQAVMFTAFVRGESDRNSRGGTGLGLAIARAVMEKHKGSILYRREHGKNVFMLVF